MHTSSLSLSDKARRFVSSTLVCAASGAVMLGFAGTAGAAVPTKQTLDPGPSVVTSGTELTFTGRLTGVGDRVHESAAKSTATESSKAINQRIVDIAAAQAGEPYVWGAEGPNSFDCSGLTQYVHAQVGISLPRTTEQQRAAVPYISKSAIMPGDLVFFHDGGSVYHVGIYAGNNKIWAAPVPGETVQLQEIWTNSYTVGRAW